MNNCRNQQPCSACGANANRQNCACTMNEMPAPCAVEMQEVYADCGCSHHKHAEMDHEHRRDADCPKPQKKCGCVYKKDKSTLMRQIAQCEFILIDINLFLDTHPTNERALADYNCYAEQLRALKDMYVMHYGPLENFGNSISEDCWKWNEQTWPWCRKSCEEV